MDNATPPTDPNITPDNTVVETPSEPVVEPAVLPNDPTGAVPTIPDPETAPQNPADVATTSPEATETTVTENVVENVVAIERPLPADALKAFLEEKNLVIELPEIKTIQIEDGSIVISVPKNIIVKYGDE